MSYAPICTQDPELWFSERVAERRKAAAFCAGCPLVEECREKGESEVHGVWGGVDRTVRWSDTDEVATAKAEARAEKEARRLRVIELAGQGLGAVAIGREVDLTHGAVGFILRQAA